VQEVIEAGAVVLRIWTAADAPVLEDIVERSRVEFADWLPNLTHELADIPAFLAQAAKSYRDGTAYVYAIVVDGEPIGQCSLGFHDDGSAEIGYWVRTDRTGRGYATTAVAAVSAAALVDGVDELVIHCDEGNAASASVARKAGYTHEQTVDLDPNLPGTRVQTWREMTWIRRRAG
jgi:RimJ/RimL family protein N-acetyltransferase